MIDREFFYFKFIKAWLMDKKPIEPAKAVATLFDSKTISDLKASHELKLEKIKFIDPIFKLHINFNKSKNKKNSPP